jgi:CheY-like chemotaxis protein
MLTSRGAKEDAHVLKRIFIADDSGAMRLLLRTWVESLPGLAVCGEAADGVEAIEKAEPLNPDLILLDFSMPRMNGLEAASALHSVAPNIPIILFTLFAESVSEDLARAAGIRAVVSKSGPIEILMDEVQRLLSRARPASA